MKTTDSTPHLDDTIHRKHCQSKPESPEKYLFLRVILYYNQIKI